jgi:hypothetical protein
MSAVKRALMRELKAGGRTRKTSDWPAALMGSSIQ